MARTVLRLTNPTVTLADTLIGLDTSPAFECQMTSATITPVPQTQTIPSTGCAPSADSPGKTKWQIDAAWLQDWGATDSLSQYAFDHDTELVWYRFEADTVEAPQVKAEGQLYLAAGGYGGTFGDGSAAVATATWPCLDKPTIVAALAAAAADTGAA